MGAANMTDHQMNNFVLDARPDRIDFRDRVYRPPLVSLPDRFPSDHHISTYLPLYHEHGMILDQGSEGACTGFGLAAVINYVTWEQWMYANNGEPDLEKSPPPPHVSHWMLYDNARVYDEWEGEDYSGSSCRGAMKGWHKHGVCDDSLWPAPPRTKAEAKKRRKTRRKRPEKEWRSDAAGRPLGAYYRVDARSLADMQAAIHEVRAVYCSARVHKGWLPGAQKRLVKITEEVELPVIEFDDEVTGGHAFALVGYTEHGFIVQNSWGEGWGWKGFALLTYEDWVQHGDDAWVAAMSARTRVASGGEISTSRSETPMQVMTSTMAGQTVKKKKAGQPWSEDKAYQHAVVMGNDGKLLRRLIETADAEDNLNKVVFENSLAALQDGKKNVMLYAHGGLNSERAAVERIMRMGPWFEANDIHPIFVVWRTSLLESIGQIGLDFVEDFKDQRDELRSEGIGDIFDRALKKLQNKFDKAFEVAAEKVIGKPVWSQMKQNADAASKGEGGARKLVQVLKKLKQAHPDFSLHLAGHSAGSIMLGHMLDDFNKASGIDTVSLYAPACSIDFAIRFYGRAQEKGVIGKGKLHVDNLSDRNERDDTVGPYGKSLLYLVSRAFEDPHKAPLLGFERCWVKPSLDEDKVEELLGRDFADDKLGGIVEWARLAKTFRTVHRIQDEREVEIFRDKEDRLQIKAVHGSFDNALVIMNANVARMLGTKKPKVEITDLRGF